jgi:DnaA family protein
MPEQFPLHFEFLANQTFNDFFAGDNQPIIENLQQCVLGNGEQKIFIRGKSGQGKSHLLQACCHYAQQHEKLSFYFDLSRYSRHQPAILNGIDEYDVVCLDNVDSIVGHKKWEHALYELMKCHYEKGHQLIISSSFLPNHMDIKTQGLKDHLNWGLILQLKTLVDTNNIDALIFKADAMGFEISPQVGRFLVIQHQAELHELWRLLEEIDRASLAAKRKLTVPFLKQLFNTNKTENSIH